MFGPVYSVLIAIDGDMEDDGVADLVEIGWSDEDNFPLEHTYEDGYDDETDEEIETTVTFYSEDDLRRWARANYASVAVVNVRPPRPKKEAE